MTSAYPMPVETLADKVRNLAVELGEWPSRNRVIKTFNVGAPKATAALDALKATGFDPAAPDTAPGDTEEVAPARRLHAVTTNPTDTQPDTAAPAPVADPISEAPTGEVSTPADPEPSLVPAADVAPVAPVARPALLR
jgi:hypothetical protein